MLNGILLQGRFVFSSQFIYAIIYLYLCIYSFCTLGCLIVFHSHLSLLSIWNWQFNMV